MQIKTILAKFAPFFQSAIVISISVLFVSSIVYAATTIGSNITTGGNLTVTGWASSTSATTTSYLYIGVDGTEPNPWDFKDGDLYVQDDTYLGSQATSVASLWIGSAGTANNLNLAGGDLYVQDGLEVDGTGYFARTTSTSATTTSYLMVGSNFTLPAAWDYNEDLAVSGDAVIANKATSTVALWIGSAGTADNLNLTGGDLYVQDGLEVDGTGYFARTTSTSATTTSYLMVGSKFTLPAAWNYNEDLAVSGDMMTNANATTTGNYSFGSTNEYIRVELSPYIVNTAWGNLPWLQGRAITGAGGVGIMGIKTGLFIGQTSDATYPKPMIMFVNSSDAEFSRITADTADDDGMYFTNAEGGYKFDKDLTIGAGVSGTNYSIIFDGENRDGQFIWDEGNNRFSFGSSNGSGIDYSIFFDGANSDGTLTWDEGLARFSFDSFVGFANNASTTGDLFVSGGTFDLTTSTGTTTPGIFSQSLVYSTSTISAGVITNGATKKSVGCLELAADNGAYYHCFIDTAAAASAMFVCQAGRCN